MTAGLPGIGIGGVFYLLCAFLMPFTELVNTFRGRTNWKRWHMVFTQFGLLCGIMAGFWLTGLLLGRILIRELASTGVQNSFTKAPNVFKIQPLFLSLFVLLAVLVFLKISNHLLDRRKSSCRKPAQKV